MKGDQVKEVRNACDHLSRLPSADDIPELLRTTKEDLNHLCEEFDCIVKNRKLLEKAGPVGHLLQPIYNK